MTSNDQDCVESWLSGIGIFALPRAGEGNDIGFNVDFEAIIVIENAKN
jgi:hypothetical protein